MENNLIDRQAAIDALTHKWDGMVTSVFDVINSLPPALPDFDEWCTDCKEYDKERNSCPRWNRVIRKTIEDVQLELKKDVIQKFHDYQVEWLKNHYDIELEPQLEELIVRFLHDTANMYMLEMERRTDETTI